MKRLSAIILSAVIVLSICACGNSSSKIVSEPYRGIVAGMTVEEVKNVEKGLHSGLIEIQDEGLLYEAHIENEVVRIRYKFKEDKLEEYTIIGAAPHGTSNVDAFYNNFGKTLSKTHKYSQQDGVDFWENEYEMIGGELTGLVGSNDPFQTRMARFFVHLIEKK